MPRRWKLALFAGAPFVVAIAPLMAFVALAGSPAPSQEFDLRDGSAVVTPNSFESSGSQGIGNEAAMRVASDTAGLDDDCPLGHSGVAES